MKRLSNFSIEKDQRSNFFGAIIIILFYLSLYCLLYLLKEENLTSNEVNPYDFFS